MARIIDAFTQFFDDNGNPLVDGFLKFVESGTNNTDKDTFADVNEAIPNANPVPLDGAGRCPNVFGTGAYNVISYTNAMVQIQQFDPVSADTLLGNFSDWDSATIYDEGDIVIGSDGLYYRSITADNQNQNPVSSPGQWEQFKFIGIWNTNITYTTGDSVYGSNGFLYISRVGSNLGNDPTTDATNWRPGTLNRYVKSADILSDNDLPLPDGVSGDVTGTTTVNGVAESLAGTLVVYQFDDVLILKHNTAASAGFDSLDLPGDADITTIAGDIIALESQGAGNLYRTVSYTKADGTPIITPEIPGDSLVLLATATASDDATIEFTGIDNTYKNYMVLFDDVIPATDTSAFYMRTSSDGGSAFDAGASDYQQVSESRTSLAAFNIATNNAEAFIVIKTSAGNATNESVSGVLRLFNPSNAIAALVSGYGAAVDEFGVFCLLNFAGARMDAADVDAIQFFFSAGNITSGEFQLYGIRDV